MKEILLNSPRPQQIGDIVKDGGLSYSLDFEWAKWPEHMRGTHTLTAQIDDDGLMYVATDDKQWPIVVFGPDGEFIKSMGVGLFSKAHSIAITAQKTILVADSSKKAHVIREITMDGDLVRDFGKMGEPGDSGYNVNYLEVLQAEGRVPDDPVWNKRAEANARLDSICKIGKPFCRPCSMIVTRSGEYFAADGYGNCAVHKFNSDGNYAFSWGGPGKEPGHFRLVHDICIDGLDRIWIADRENSRAQAFDQSGNVLAVVYGNLMRVGGVWSDDDYVYIGELDGGVTILNMDLSLKAQLGCKGSVIHSHGITGDKNGNLYIFTNKKNDNSILRLKKL
jgi:hypothetical protein